MAKTFSGVEILPLDDNLSNGKTYVFQFRCSNWFCLFDLSAKLSQDIIDQAPDFMTSVQIVRPLGGFGATEDLYNVQFTYEGDGSDVVSDLATSLQAAFKIGSNDDMVFIGATQSTSADVVVTPTQAATVVEQKAIDAVSKVTQDVTKAATDAVNAALKGLMPLLIVVVLLILFVVPAFVKSTGVKVSAG